jgi:Glycine/D-amino acid oxidases (deaminating)
MPSQPLAKEAFALRLLDTYPVRPSFWGVPPAVEAAEFVGDEDCDLLVVGGGLAGLSTALHCLRRDPSLSVTLLEARYCGYGASGRNFCNVAQLAKTDIGVFIDSFGAASTAFIVEHQAQMFIDFQQLLAAEAISCEFAVAELLHLAHTDVDAERMGRIRELHASYGFPSELLDSEAARDRINLDATAALSTGWNGYAQPFMASRGLRAAALRRGLRLHESSAVTHLAREGSAWVATTQNGRVRSRTCVLATNASTPALGIAIGRLTPTYTYALATEPLEQAAFEQIGWSPRHRLINDFGERYWYMQMRPNRQLLIGDATTRPTTGDGITLPPHNDQSAYRRIHAELITRFPWLEGVGIDCAWGGPLDMTASRLPTVQPIDDGLWLNAGYSARGYLLASLSGRVIAPVVTEVAADGDAEYARFASVVLSGLVE